MDFLPSADPALPFSAAVTVNGIVYMSGNIGIRPDGTLPDGFEAQARLALENMRDSLRRAGCTIDDVIKCTVMLADMERWSEFNNIYLPYFKPGRLPARSAFGTSGLALGALVEIECLAKAPG